MFVKKDGKWVDVRQEDMQKIENAFYVTARADNEKYLRVIIKDLKRIDPDKLYKKLNKSKFLSDKLVGLLTEERIPRLVIRLKGEVIPYNLLPIEIYKTDGTYKINGLSDIIGKVIEQIKVSTQNMDTETSITVPIPNDLKSYITSSSKLPGQMYFFQKLKSKDYYF